MIAVRPLEGAVAGWRHGDVLPYLEVVLWPPHAEERQGRRTTPARPASACVATGPARYPLEGITDPAELRAMAWMLLDAARWLERAAGPRDDDSDDPQMSIYDALEA